MSRTEWKVTRCADYVFARKQDNVTQYEEKQTINSKPRTLELAGTEMQAVRTVVSPYIQKLKTWKEWEISNQTSEDGNYKDGDEKYSRWG